MWAWLEYNIFVTVLFGSVITDVPLNLLIGTGTTIVSVFSYWLLRLPQEERVMESDRSLPGFKFRLE